MPMFSICIPTFNREALLPMALKSALGQSFIDFEVCIYDDGSQDDTPNIVAAFADPRIRYEHASRNEGVAHARNELMQMARGVWIAWLDSDDAFNEYRLATVLWCLKTCGDPYAVRTSFRLMPRRNRTGEEWKGLPSLANHPLYEKAAKARQMTVPQLVAENERRFKTGEALIEVPVRKPYAAAATVIRTSVCRLVPFNERLMVGEDRVHEKQIQAAMTRPGVYMPVSTYIVGRGARGGRLQQQGRFNAYTQQHAVSTDHADKLCQKVVDAMKERGQDFSRDWPAVDMDKCQNMVNCLTEGTRNET